MLLLFQGVPVRLEVGPRDIKQGQCKAVIRFNGEKMMLNETDAPEKISELLEKIQSDMKVPELDCKRYTLQSCTCLYLTKYTITI